MTKKHGKSHYGYKNHINIDRRHKLVRRYQVSEASLHDSRVFADILDADNTASDVWADSAYRSDEIEKLLAEKGAKSRIHHRLIATNRWMDAVRRATKPARRCGHVWSMCLEHKATTWAELWCAALASPVQKHISG